RMAMVLIHGDLNSRNIIVGTKNSNPNEIHSINFIDFSHTGNGLTRSRTSDFKEYLYKQNGEYLGHVADDFFRLEADIKFSLTNLQTEQAWRQVWILENLMLEQGLQLHSWDDLIAAHAFAHFLQRSGLVNEAAWQELAENTAWESADAYQYKQMWQCVRAIRAALVTVLERPPQSMVPYYIAQLQTGLTMIYWEDERFYNAELQKLYMAMSAALLCKQLSINNQ
ncbi:MAG: hypothetical protein KC421_16210, partial [Anaerolineales bacterium]|nr:hypothetical protein [Anaerolineales bacterium]